MTTDNLLQPIKTNRLSLATQAQQRLLHLIESGQYPAGAQLPSEANLSRLLGISRATLREALRNLEQAGVIIRKQGVGTYVTPRLARRLESGLERFESILKLAERQGLQIGFDDLQIEQKPANHELADALQVAPGTPLTHIQRTIISDEIAIAYMHDVALASILAVTDVGRSFNGSVLDLLRQNRSLQIAQAVSNIVAVNASSFLARKLQVKVRQALLLLEETMFDQEGRAVEFSRNYFNPHYFRWHVLRR